MPRFHLETIRRIYDEKIPSDYLEIGPDADTGEFAELRYYSRNELTNKYDITNRIAIDPEAIDLVIEALQHFRKV